MTDEYRTVSGDPLPADGQEPTPEPTPVEQALRDLACRWADMAPQIAADEGTDAAALYRLAAEVLTYVAPRGERRVAFVMGVWSVDESRPLRDLSDEVMAVIERHTLPDPSKKAGQRAAVWRGMARSLRKEPSTPQATEPEVLMECAKDLEQSFLLAATGSGAQ